MGEQADEAIERMLNDQQMPWYNGSMRYPQHERFAPHVNCRTVMKPLLPEEGEIVRTPTNNVCPFCHKSGLHWSLVEGKNRLREEGGWLHHCAPVEGVTLSL